MAMLHWAPGDSDDDADQGGPSSWHRDLNYEMSLQMRDGHARLSISGVLDELCVDALAGIVGRGGPVAGPVEIDVRGIRRVARGSVAMLRSVAVDRVTHGGTDLFISAVSVPVASALADLGIATALPIPLCGDVVSE
jgi:hypothetical protein